MRLAWYHPGKACVSDGHTNIGGTFRHVYVAEQRLPPIDRPGADGQPMSAIARFTDSSCI